MSWGKHETLPKAQHTMIRLWVLGGADAVKHHSTRTVDSLISDGYLDRDGPTKRAIEYVEDYELRIGTSK